MKRVNQAYVIATSTKISVDSVDLQKFDDAYFKPTEKKVKKKGEKEFFETEDSEKKVRALHTPLVPMLAILVQRGKAAICLCGSVVLCA